MDLCGLVSLHVALPPQIRTYVHHYCTATMRSHKATLTPSSSRGRSAAEDVALGLESSEHSTRKRGFLLGAMYGVPTERTPRMSEFLRALGGRVLFSYRLWPSQRDEREPLEYNGTSNTPHMLSLFSGCGTQEAQTVVGLPPTSGRRLTVLAPPQASSTCLSSTLPARHTLCITHYNACAAQPVQWSSPECRRATCS